MWSRRNRGSSYKSPREILREQAQKAKFAREHVEAKIYNATILNYETVVLTNDASIAHLENGCMVLSTQHVNFGAFTKAINRNTKVKSLTIKPDTIEGEEYCFFIQFGVAYNKSITHLEVSSNQLGIPMRHGGDCDYHAFSTNDLVSYNRTLQYLSLNNTLFTNQAAHFYKLFAERNPCLIHIETGGTRDTVNAPSLASLQLAVGKNIFRKIEED